MSESIRTFIAIELNEGVRAELAILQATLKKSDADVKWVAPQVIHLTLKFLGNIDDKVVKEVQNILSDIVKNFKPFSLSFKEMGAFPKLDYPRVIWVEVDEGKDIISQLAKELEDKLEAINIPKEDREFHPHITLGRVKTSKNKDKLRVIIETTKFEPSSKIAVDHLTLFKSQLTPQGSVYTPLFIAKMRELPEPQDSHKSPR